MMVRGNKLYLRVYARVTLAWHNSRGCVNLWGMWPGSKVLFYASGLLQ